MMDFSLFYVLNLYARYGLVETVITNKINLTLESPIKFLPESYYKTKITFQKNY